MRRKQKQDKLKQVVAIPADLFEFICHVHEMIETNDESAFIESDDLIQCEVAYSGLIEQGGIRYGFTYFPKQGIRQKWEFELDIVDIANISEEVTTTLVLWGCKDANCCSMFSDPEDTCFYCDYIDDASVPD